MEAQITAWYKEATALYAVAGNNGYMMATLLDYSGAPHNKPPERFIMISNEGRCKSLPEEQQLIDTISKELAKKTKSSELDPLFPDTAFRHRIVDYLV